MRPFGSPNTLERRRRRAITLLAQGFSLREVARRVQASVGSVSQWRQAWQQGGEVALAPKPTPGGSHRLAEAPASGPVPPLPVAQLPSPPCGRLPPSTLAASSGAHPRALGPRLDASGAGHRGGVPGPPP